LPEGPYHVLNISVHILALNEKSEIGEVLDMKKHTQKRPAVASSRRGACSLGFLKRAYFSKLAVFEHPSERERIS